MKDIYTFASLLRGIEAGVLPEVEYVIISPVEPQIKIISFLVRSHLAQQYLACISFNKV